MPASFADLHRPVGRYFRRRRLRRFAREFGLKESTTVLDLGGAEHYWAWCPVHPRVTVVNLQRRDLHPDLLAWVQADGCQLPFADEAFDVVHCNSVIEHLPDQPSRERLAREIARVGRGYWVQTPSRWFPVEAHTLTPGLHFLPKPWQVRLARNFTVWGWLQRPDPAEAREFVEHVHLLSAPDLKGLFPDASIMRERFLGMTKSVTAVRQQRG